MNQDRNEQIMAWRSMQRIRELQLMRELNDEWRARQSPDTRTCLGEY